MDVWDIVTRFVLPPLLGGASGLAVVWLNWDIEQKRERLGRRRSLVDLWRSDLIEKWDDDFQHGTASGLILTQQGAYASLQPHLSTAFRERVEYKGGKMKIIITGDPLWAKRQLSEEISRIEREWKLV